MEETQILRCKLWDAQRGICGLCGKPMRGGQNDSLDHVIPHSLGGHNGAGNSLLCHSECNGRKSNDVPTGCEMVFLLAVNARIGALPLVF
jgi:5-methylcytosine-specific restriction endonuclease McrA